MQKLGTPGGSGECQAAPNFMLDAALCYARRGWAVLPLHSPLGDGCSCLRAECAAVGKHPRIAKGLHAATTDERTIRGWWVRWPEANIGIATGIGIGIVVLDVDGAHGEGSWGRLRGSRPHPVTLEALTGRTGENGARAGRHCYFLHPLKGQIRNSTGRLGLGLDVRGAGGFVVAPPSLHLSGLRYEWREPFAEVSALPDWLESLLIEEVAAQPSIAAVTLPEGIRNDRLFRYACGCRRRGADEQTILKMLQTQNTLRCVPQLAELELARIAASAARYPIGGKDILEVAYSKVQAKEHLSLEAKLLALARHLQNMRPTYDVALPQERIGRLLGCDPTLVSRYRRRLVQQGWLIPTRKYIAKRMAALYRVL